MPEDKNKLSDSELFRQSIGKIKRIHTDKHHQPSSSLPSTQDRSLAKAAFANTPSQKNINPHSLVEGAETILVVQPGLQRKTIKHLKSGSIHIDDALDLHGLTEVKAQQALRIFLAEQAQFSHHCALIIHGKGHGSDNKYPTLKNMTVHVLSNTPNVLAFTSAQPQDGGVGALYVLFKKAQD